MSGAFSGTPTRVLRPYSQHHERLNSSTMKYSNLPSENICTENLTPWKKLLPCEVSSGFVQLLNANQLFNSKYMSIDVNAYKTCVSETDCSSIENKMTMTVNVVFDGFRIRDYSRTLSLLTLFHKPMGKVCPLADRTSISAQSYKKDCSIVISTKGDLVKSETLALTQEDRYSDVNFDRKCHEGEISQSNDEKITKAPILVHKYLSSGIGGLSFYILYLLGFRNSSC